MDVHIKTGFILCRGASLRRVIVPSAGIKRRQRVAWYGHMEAEPERGRSVLTAGT